MRHELQGPALETLHRLYYRPAGTGYTTFMFRSSEWRARQEQSPRAIPTGMLPLREARRTPARCAGPTRVHITRSTRLDTQPRIRRGYSDCRQQRQRRMGANGGHIESRGSSRLEPQHSRRDRRQHCPLAKLGTLATVSLAATGGTSGIIMDNTVGSGTLAGASEVYFSTQGNQTCGTTGTGGCAVQASQSALQ